jgi:small conductance mechanosensitive channel
MEEALPKLWETVFLFLPRIGASVVVVLGFWLLAAIAGNLLARIGKRTRLAGDVISLIARAGKVALIIFGIVTALGTVGINVSALVAGLGLTGFALGFALKDALSNIRHGQRIEVSGYQGTVANIDFRYTTLQTEEKTILLPNANLFTNTMVVFHNNSRVTDNNRQRSSAASAEPLHDRG